MAKAQGGSRSRVPWRTLGLIVVLAICGVLLVRWLGPETFRTGLEALWTRLEQAPPLVFFASMALVCLLPVPITLFYVSAGPLFGVVPALLWIMPTLVVNQLLGHVLATGILRPRIEELIEGHGYTVPTVAGKSDQTLFTAVVRITPGFPYFLQNMVLGIAGVERTRYLLISVPIQMIYATAFVVLGRSAFEGDLGIAASALAGVIVAAICARVIHRRLQVRDNPDEDPSADAAGHSAPH